MMEARELIESGQLELYVYGLLTAEENAEINRIALVNKDVADEIIAIEDAIISLSSGFSPDLSTDQYQRLRDSLIAKQSPQPIETINAAGPEERPARKIWTVIGWTAALLFLASSGYLFYQWQEATKALVVSEQENTAKDARIKALEITNKQNQSTLELMRSPQNLIVDLEAQPVAPDASARIYWNKETQAVSLDASSLATPPEGNVYQVWAIYYKPFNAVSIGVLENNSAENLHTLQTTANAEAFGVTLEPIGGSETPTLEQLVVMGKTK